MILKRLMFANVALALSILFSAVSLAAQTPPARFKGIVVDAHIARIRNASVVIESAEKKWKLVTDEDGKTVGEINIELPIGKYRFTVDAPGFKQLVVVNFCVASGATIAYQFRLDVRSNDDHNILPPDQPEPIPPSAPQL